MRFLIRSFTLRQLEKRARPGSLEKHHSGVVDILEFPTQDPFPVPYPPALYPSVRYDEVNSIQPTFSPRGYSQ